AGVPQGPGPRPAARPAGAGHRHPPRAPRPPGPALVRRRVRRPGLRRLAVGVPARRRAGAAAGSGRQATVGPRGLADGVGPSDDGGAVGLALGPGHGERAGPFTAVAADPAGAHAARRRRRVLRLRPAGAGGRPRGLVPGAFVVGRVAVHGGPDAAGALARGAGVLLAPAGAAAGPAAVAAAPGARARPEGRRVAAH